MQLKFWTVFVLKLYYNGGGAMEVRFVEGYAVGFPSFIWERDRYIIA